MYRRITNVEGAESSLILDKQKGGADCGPEICATQYANDLKAMDLGGSGAAGVDVDVCGASRCSPFAEDRAEGIPWPGQAREEGDAYELGDLLPGSSDFQ